MVATWTNPMDANQNAARSLGYTGDFGSGGIGAWRQQNGISDAQFTAAGASGFAPTNIPAGNTGNGILPLGQVASFTQPQQAALTAINNGPAALGYMNGAQGAFQAGTAQAPNATPFYNQGNNFYQQAGQYLQNGTAPLTNDQLQSSIQGYMNPYTQNVVNSAVKDINQQAGMQRSAIAGQASQAGAFGGDAQGIENGLNDQYALKQVGDTSGTLNYQGFTDAANNALNQYRTQTGNNLQAAGTAAGAGAQSYAQGNSAINNNINLANTGFAGNQANLNNFYTQANAQLGAGNVIQNQNQNILNSIKSAQTGPTQFLNSTLTPYLQNAGVGANAGQANTFSQAGGLLNTLPSFLSSAATFFG